MTLADMSLPLAPLKLSSVPYALLARNSTTLQGFGIEIFAKSDTVASLVGSVATLQAAVSGIAAPSTSPWTAASGGTGIAYSGGQVNVGDTLEVSGDIAAQGRLSVGAVVPAASAALEVNSTTGGFLPPRMSVGARDGIASPADGLVVYNTDAHSLDFYRNGAWVSLGAGPSCDWTTQIYDGSACRATHTHATGAAIDMCYTP